MILRDVMVPGKELKCDVCGWYWITIIRTLPACCPNKTCRSREWNGKKVKRSPSLTRIQLPKPPKVRTIVGEEGEY